jgi:diguanylate cyclase (GGDEF)-like protein
MRAPDRHPQYLLLYTVIFAATWGLLGLSAHLKPVELIVAGVLQLATGVSLWTWRRTGVASTRRFMLGTAALMASVGLLRDGSGYDPGFAVLVLCPVMLAATRANRVELIFAWVAAALTLYLPEIIVGAPHYPAWSLVDVTITLLVGIVLGATVLALVRELSEGHERQEQLIDEARTQLLTEDALRRVATLVAAGAPSAELFSAVSMQLARVAGASIGAVVRFQPDSSIGELVGGWRADTKVFSGRKVDLNRHSAAAHVYRTGESVILHVYPAQEAVDGAVAAVAAPIVVSGRLWGAASAIFKQDEAIPAGISKRFERFAELVAMAIANADHFSELVEHATVDSLTGIANRRRFDEQLRRELERASRRERPLSVVLLDVDHFKAVNDTHGHQTGDRVLEAIALVLTAQARTGETVARFGGEEFVWLMPDTTAEEAVVATERARRAVAEMDLETVGRVTMSAGVNSNQAAASGTLLLAGADEALYEAKARGRDQVVAAPSSLSSVMH